MSGRMANHAALLDNPTQSRRRAKNDLAYVDTIRNEDDRRKRDLAMSTLGKPAQMSPADQNAAARGASLGGGILPGQTNASPRARLVSPVASSVNIGNSTVPLNVNTPNAQQDAAILASPAPVAPGRAANQTGGPIDYNAIAARRAQAGGVTPNPTQPPSSTGRTLTAAQGDAALGPVTGANGYGTGSVRFAKAGEERQGPSQVTENGVIGQAPAAYDPEAARRALYAKHPAIFKAGTPENLAFDAHAKQFGLEDAHKNADMIVGRIATANAAATNPNRAMADAANPMPTVKPEPIARVRDTFPTQPSPAMDAGRRVAGSIVGAAKSVGGAIDRNIISPVENFTRGAGNFVRGLVGNKTPLPAYQPSVDPTATPPSQVAPSTVPNPVVPPAQSPPVAETVDQDKLKKKLKSPLL